MVKLALAPRLPKREVQPPADAEFEGEPSPPSKPDFRLNKMYRHPALWGGDDCPDLD